MDNSLIKRQDAINAIKSLWNNAPSAQHVSAMFDCEDAIRALPSVEPERKKGKWIREPGHIPKCSICGIYSDDADRGYDKFCPNCGADMRGEQE